MSNQTSTIGKPKDAPPSGVYEEAWWESDQSFDKYLASLNKGSKPHLNIHAMQQSRARSQNSFLNQNSSIAQQPAGAEYSSLQQQQLIRSTEPSLVFYPPRPVSPTEGNHHLPPLPQLRPQHAGVLYQSSEPQQQLIRPTEPSLVFYPPRPVSPSEGNYHLPPQYIRLVYPPSELQQRQSTQPVPVSSAPNSCKTSQLVPTHKGKRPAQSGAGITKKRRLSHKTQERIETLRDLIPYPPKEDAVSTLADVVDYIIQLKDDVDQLKKQKLRLQALKQSHSRMQSQTSAPDYERSNQMGRTQIGPTTSNFSDNQTADGGAAGVPKIIS